MSEPILSAVDLTASVRLPDGSTLPILRGVSLDIHPGESVAIMGRSGSGKTTLLSLLGLLSRPDSGQVMLLGRDASRVGDRERAALRNAHLGFVFQSYSLVRHLNARANVELPLRYGSGVPRAVRRQRVQAALEAVGLGERGSAKPRHLSGGEQQRIAIARALVREPSVILADEPTGALDTSTAESVLTVLLHSARDRGTAIVIVTHDPAVAARLDRTVHINGGELVAAPRRRASRSRA